MATSCSSRPSGRSSGSPRRRRSGQFEIHAFEIYGAVMVVFFLICFPLTRLAAYLERRLVA